jgi:hypothetical protein
MSWAAVSATPAGSDTQVQYNNGGTAFGAASTFTFNNSTGVVTATGFSGALNGTVGATTANTGAFTTLSASSTVGGTGFSTYLASPPAIGGTAPAAGTFTSGTFSSTVHKGSVSGTVTLAAPATAGTQSYTLPTGQPTANGQALTATTAGVMSWATPTAGAAGSNTQIQYNSTNALAGSADLVWDGTSVGVGTNTPSTYSDSTPGITTYNSSAGGRSGIVMGSNATATDDLMGYVACFNSNSSNTNYRMAQMRFLRGTDANSAYFAWHTANSANPAERMRLDQSGNLLIGTTTAGAGITFTTKLALDAGNAEGSVFKNSAGNTAYCMRTWNATNTTDNLFIAFMTETVAAQRGNINYNRGAGLVAYNTTSDYRAKDIYGPVTNSGEVIDSVPVYMGKMKEATQERPMFIAHETPAYAHTGEKDAVDADGNPIYQQMDVSALVPVLWAEVKSLRARIAALEPKEQVATPTE